MEIHPRMALNAIKSSSTFALVGPSLAFFSEHQSVPEALRARDTIVNHSPTAQVFIYRRCVREWFKY
jgi:hypothetical protein